ncbi:MAG: MBL fold metallo-hydrolase [Erysipelotrichaceae bacterium]|nr:MBL fold metallo-hydrolase [Erysipelotrichaceae bacterium]MBR4609970.1 MBL fold metallo-hydrolase [Erysipelotrichaceae bacterium]
MNSTVFNSVEKIADDLYMITETNSIHCYLLIGEDKALLIDAGWGYEDINPIIRQITDKPVMLAITHGDPDHALGAAHFEEFWIHPLDLGKVYLNDNYNERKGMLEHRLKKMPELIGKIDVEAFSNARMSDSIKAHFLLDHEVIDLGGKHVECILVPGHSYGHLMYLEKETGRLFSGDQLVDHHNIWHFSSRDEQAPFSVTLNSLRQLKKREDEINVIYPAHAKTPADKECLDELIECFEWELERNYLNDIPFHSYKGDAWHHFYKSVDLIYSDERLEEYLGYPIKRNS